MAGSYYVKSLPKLVPCLFPVAPILSLLIDFLADLNPKLIKKILLTYSKVQSAKKFAPQD